MSMIVSAHTWSTTRPKYEFPKPTFIDLIKFEEDDSMEREKLHYYKNAKSNGNIRRLMNIMLQEDTEKLSRVLGDVK